MRSSAFDTVILNNEISKKIGYGSKIESRIWIEKIRAFVLFRYLVILTRRNCGLWSDAVSDQRKIIYTRSVSTSLFLRLNEYKRNRQSPTFMRSNRPVQHTLALRGEVNDGIIKKKEKRKEALCVSLEKRRPVRGTVRDIEGTEGVPRIEKGRQRNSRKSRGRKKIDPIVRARSTDLSLLSPSACLHET